MGFMKKYKILLVLALVVVAGGFLFFYRMYQHDMKSLEDFVASYQTFDTAISDFSTSGTDESENKALLAFNELTAKAGVRMSSLIRNDSLIPPATLKVADLARKELDAVKAHQIAGDLTAQRKVAYARFQELDSEK